MPTDAEHDLVGLIKDVVHSETGIDVADLGPGDDLYQAGVTSFMSVNVMLALEDRLDVEFRDHMLNRTTFSTLGHLSDALAHLLDGARS